MRLLSILAAILSIAVVAPSAHADTLSTFQLENVTFYGSSNLATGTVVIDITNGTFASVDVDYTYDGTLLSFNSSDPGTLHGPSNDNSGVHIPGVSGTTLWDSTNQAEIWLYVPGSVLFGYDGGSLCAGPAFCGSVFVDGDDFFNYGSEIDFAAGGLRGLETGTLHPAASPEPSSFLLLGSGLLGIGGMLKRRLIA